MCLGFLVSFGLGFDIVAEHAAVILLTVLCHILQFDGCLLRDVLCRPDLTVRMRVRATHDGALIFKDLDVIDMVLLLHGIVG